MPYRLIETTEPAPVTDETFWVLKSEMIPMGASHYQILEAHDGRTFERIVMPAGEVSWQERQEVSDEAMDKEGYAASPVYVIYTRCIDNWQGRPKERFKWQLEYRNGAIISQCVEYGGKHMDDGERVVAGYPFRTVEECNESILRHRHQALSPFVSYPARYKGVKDTHG